MLTWHHGHKTQLFVWALVSSSRCQQLSGGDSLIEYRNRPIWAFLDTPVCRGARPWVVLWVHSLRMSEFVSTSSSSSSSPSLPVSLSEWWTSSSYRWCRSVDEIAFTLQSRFPSCVPPPVRRCRGDVFRCLECRMNDQCVRSSQR